MAGSGLTSTKTGLKKGFSMGGSGVQELIPEQVEKGYGTPAHAAPVGTLYVKLDATMGTSSHYRNTGTTAIWAAMSDD